MVAFVKKLVFRVYVLLLMGFTVWYGHFMYPLIFGFEGKEQAEVSLREMAGAGTMEERIFNKLIAEQTQKQRMDLGYRVIEQPYIPGRFHHIGFSIEPDLASICVRCHGNVPHDKSRELRSFLNMHAFYIACETCHVPPSPEEAEWDFRWYDKKSGKVAENPRALLDIEALYTGEVDEKFYPVYGNYGAKVAPGVDDFGEFRFLHGEKEMNFVNRYIEEQDRLSPERKSQMKKVIHRRVSTKPIQCRECHNAEEPYIPFEELGYPPSRISELTNVAVVGMIQKYKEFYMPNLLKPGGVD